MPVNNGGSDEYTNLILVSKEVHILIHASSEPTIEKYLKSLNLDDKQIEKLNKLRTMAEMHLLFFEFNAVTKCVSCV